MVQSNPTLDLAFCRISLCVYWQKGTSPRLLARATWGLYLHRTTAKGCKYISISCKTLEFAVPVFGYSKNARLCFCHRLLYHYAGIPFRRYGEAVSCHTMKLDRASQGHSGRCPCTGRQFYVSKLWTQDVWIAYELTENVTWCVQVDELKIVYGN